jgi:light-regulated signal transduction histidine kinase (bacteriophytochrome)
MGVAIAGMHYMGMAAARYRAATVAQSQAGEPLVGAVPLRDIVGFAEIVFAGALVALTTRSAIDRQKALEAYQQLNAELEARVRARTVELETTNNELSAFTYTVSHDLRSPLRTIGGFAEILAESPDVHGENRHHVERIRNAAARMDALLSGMLHLAHVARAKLEKTDVDLSALAQSIVADLAVQEPGRTADITIEPDVRVCADPALLTSVMQNLLQNAWKFSARANPARIAFGTERRGEESVFYVRDNGVGFNVNGKLFGVFERLHSGADYPGHGIGLAVTKRIIERHGGRIWAESAPGQGTTIRFTLA